MANKWFHQPVSRPTVRDSARLALSVYIIIVFLISSLSILVRWQWHSNGWITFLPLPYQLTLPSIRHHPKASPKLFGFIYVLHQHRPNDINGNKYHHDDGAFKKWRRCLSLEKIAKTSSSVRTMLVVCGVRGNRTELVETAQSDVLIIKMYFSPNYFHRQFFTVAKIFIERSRIKREELSFALILSDTFYIHYSPPHRTF